MNIAKYPAYPVTDAETRASIGLEPDGIVYHLSRHRVTSRHFSPKVLHPYNTSHNV